MYSWGCWSTTLDIVTCKGPQVLSYSADIFTCSHIWLFDTAYISPWYLVSLADSIFCCCAWMILQRQGSQDPTTFLPLPTGRPRLRMRPGGRKKERDGMALKWEHLATWKVRKKCYGKNSSGVAG